MNTKIVKLLLIFSLSFFLVTCIDIDTEIIIRQNFTGEISIKYSISKDFINIGQIDIYDAFLPLPIEERKYRELAANVNGLVLRSFRQEETEAELLITVRYEFSNIDALNAVISNSNDTKIEVQSRGERVYYTQKISNNDKPASEEALKFAQALFPERYVKLRLIVPQNIQTVNSGAIRGNSAEVSYNLIQLLATTDSVTWEVSW